MKIKDPRNLKVLDLSADYSIVFFKPTRPTSPCPRCNKRIPDGENVILMLDTNDARVMVFGFCERCFISKADTTTRIANYLETGKGLDDIRAKLMVREGDKWRQIPDTE